MAEQVIKQTDRGVTILHGLLIAALLVSILTGLSLAFDAPQLWPFNMTREWHILSSFALYSIAFAYVGYTSQTARPDKTRLLGLFGQGQQQLGMLNAVLHWGLLIIFAMMLITGALMYTGQGTIFADLHRLGTSLLLGFPVGYILVHYAVSGISKLAATRRRTS